MGLVGGADLGGQTAEERSSSAGATFGLFDTATELGSAPAFDVRLGVAITSRFTVEGRASLSRPELRTSISGDTEGAPAITAVESVDQYLFDGGVAVRLGGRATRLVPFVSAGAGYHRQLHEGQTLAEGGSLFYAGGGVTRWLVVRRQGLVRAAGFRADARLYFLSGGISPDTRCQAALSGGVTLVF